MNQVMSQVGDTLIDLDNERRTLVQHDALISLQAVYRFVKAIQRDNFATR